MKVLVYALADVFYYSFYLKGLFEIYGKDKIKYTIKEFPNLPERTFAFILKSGGTEKKVIIDAFDSPHISSVALDWCDGYAKVNYQDAKITGFNTNKIFPIAPGFGIRIWNFLETVFHAFSNYNLARERVRDKREFFANYWRQFKRLPLQEYQNKGEVKGNYIYFISSLWQREEAANQLRAKFIKACLDLEELNFEGGFAPRSDGKTLGYSSLISERISLRTYVKKIKSSILVFNTPAVEQCHGWKLGEYLAMGKAIISTNHINVLPQDLIHQKHLHYVGTEQKEITEAIKLLTENRTYRIHLEENAKNYFERNIHPRKVLERIMTHLEKNHLKE